MNSLMHIMMLKNMTMFKVGCVLGINLLLRCSAVNIDTATGKKDPNMQPLKTLQRYE